MEVIWNALNYISEEMGITLRNTAYSPNIRDRQDHSCAILSREGYLVAQAEHIPVHIGSMAVGLRNTLEYIDREGLELDRDDVIIVNNPYISGTHLNDVTLIKPLYIGNIHIGYLANKAHHIDIGGKVPGSIGGEVSTLFEEGVVINPTYIIRRGEINNKLINEVSSNLRTPAYFKGDLMAQIASLNIGAKRFHELTERFKRESIIDSMYMSLDYVETYLRNVLNSYGLNGEYIAEDYLEGLETDIKIRVSIKFSKNRIKIDYTGSSEEVDIPLNAVYGVTVSASTFSIKSVFAPETPFNHAIYRILEIYAPKGSILNPNYPKPVSGGNLETSQRIVDTVLKALSEIDELNIPAASNGSMNNIMLGGRDWAFYETIGGGAGGRPFEDGVDGVHTNMTNTLNTPIEIMEREYPILFLKYGLREDSCGYGKYRGGLGIVRKFKVLDKSTLTIVASRTRYSPYGLRGGKPGEKGLHRVIRGDGDVIILNNIQTVDLEEGDIIEINTPGGGGFGEPSERSKEYILGDIEEGKVSNEFLQRLKIKYVGKKGIR